MNAFTNLPGPFAWWGRLLYRRRWTVVVLWLMILIAAVPALPRVASRLRAGGFADDRLPSLRAQQTLERQLGISSNVIAVFYRSARPYAEPEVRVAVAQSLQRLSGLPQVQSAIPPDLNSRQIGRSGRTAYALVTLAGKAEDSLGLLPVLEQRAAVAPLADGTPVETLIAGGASFFRDLQEETERDLRRAELITVPVAGIALALVFGSLAAAALPVVAGAATAALGLAGIYALSFATDLSIFALNLASMLALGLGTDYALFLVSRFREELAEQGDTGRAVEVTVATAGRAVFFSAGTVLVGLTGLVAFRFMLLRSLGLAGIVAAGAAVAAALGLLPAILAIVGPRVNALAIRRKSPLPQPLSHKRRGG